ncbi:arginine--tRNA ligase [Candidatus Falkowbacteria bacterium]|nr:arginine--tRNA ligase [Candidatus Falkowbacteria bacterium]
MYSLEEIKKHIADQANKALKKKLVSLSDLNYPPNPEMGDISLPLFKLSQELKNSPNEIASSLIGHVKADEMIASLKVIGPYLNFFLNKEYLIKNTLKEIKKTADKYGQKKAEDKKTAVLEFSNVNTHKEYHVGHLRNLCFGDSVTKIMNSAGHKAISISYVNDFGIHVAKTLWNFDEFTKDKDVENMSDNEKGYLLGKMYVDAAAKEKDDPMAKQMIGGLMSEIELKKSEAYELWQKTRQWSIKHFADIYEDLKVEFKDILYESENIERGRKIIDELVEKGVLKIDEGAVIADLKEYGLEVLVCIRSNKTAAYPVADLGLAETKSKKFKPDESIYIVDNRQELYLKQLFKILELSGHKEKLIHLSYDFVKLPSGMMSSRTGNVITYSELKKIVIEKASDEIKKRHDNWSEEEIEKVAKVVGMGAIKFEMIKVDAKNIITFDVDKALSFDGYTSSYVQYAYARIAGIFERNMKKEITIEGYDPKYLKEAVEIAIIKKMSRYPEALSKAAENYDPSEIAKYLYELAKLLNDYYHQVSIINSEEKVKESRLSLLAAIAQVIKNGFGLLGIEIVEEM